MRTALRTSIVTAALAGALLAPAAGTAFAAAPQTVASVSASGVGSLSDDDRYAGEPVYVGQGLVAVLRNKSEGPEVWVRQVGTQWKPGDQYILHVVTVLDRKHLTLATNGLELKLTKAETAAPVLVVTADGVTRSHPLPKGKAGPVCATEAKVIALGGSFFAEVSMSPAGPEVAIRTPESHDEWRHLDRTSPALSESDGIIARIVNPGAAEPVFEWRAQGGATPLGRSDFPALPKGCAPDYAVKDSTSTPTPAPKPTATAAPTPATPAAPTTPTDVKPQTKGQTTVVPRGAVAAGAEITAEDTDNTTTVAAGAGLVSIVIALGAAAVHRARRGRARG